MVANALFAVKILRKVASSILSGLLIKRQFERASRDECFNTMAVNELHITAYD